MTYLSLIFPAAIFAFLVFMDLYALKYSFEARLFPLVIGVPSAILAFTVLLKEIARLRQAQAADGKSLSGPTDIDFRPYVLIIAWMAGYVIMIFILGFYVSSTLFVFIYLKTKGLAWSRSLWLSAGLCIAIYLLFSFGMEMSVYHGLIYNAYLK